MLEADYDVIVVDLRGHGKSEAPDDGYANKTIASEVAGLITGLDLNKPAVMGHSLGAMTTLTVANLFPDLPRAIILEDPPAFWCATTPTKEEQDFRAGMRARFHEFKRKTHAELLEVAKTDFPTWSQADVDPWVDSKHRFSLKILQMFEPREAVPANISTLLKQITCPTLLLTADPARGAILTDEDANELQRLVPQAQREHIPGAGQYPPRSISGIHSEHPNILMIEPGYFIPNICSFKSR